jgi:opacity protein-like surface antigen
MNLFKIPCALTLLALASAPESVYANEGGWYTTAIFGVASQSDQALDFTGNGNPQTANSRLSSGGLAGAALGYGFPSGWRVEGEFIYQSVDAKDPGLLPPAPVGKGDYASTGLALNALYDFDLFGSKHTTTYLGAGVVMLNEVDIDFENNGIERSYSGSDTALQLLFGARYRLGERFFMDAGLRYLTASSVRLESEDGAFGEIRADYQPWAATVALGWQF